MFVIVTVIWVTVPSTDRHHLLFFQWILGETAGVTKWCLRWVTELGATTIKLKPDESEMLSIKNMTGLGIGYFLCWMEFHSPLLRIRLALFLDVQVMEVASDAFCQLVGTPAVSFPREEIFSSYSRSADIQIKFTVMCLTGSGLWRVFRNFKLDHNVAARLLTGACFSGKSIWFYAIGEGF